MRAHTYADHLVGQGFKAKTVREYRREVEWAKAWFDARGLSLRTATPSQVAEYADTRPHTPGVRSHLRAALVHWWDWQGVDGWPKAIDVPSEGERICKALDPSDATAIVKTAMGWWRPGTAVLIGAYLGFRNEEIATLRWESFDRDLEWCRIVGKNSKQRTVAVPKPLADELAPRRAKGYLFVGRTGGHVSHTAIWKWVRQVADAAGVEERVWPHRLRHTFAATANDNTGQLRAVMTAMGHSRPETTARYTRTTGDALRLVADSLDYL